MSQKRYRITIRGKEYEVEVGDVSTSPVTVTVDGEQFDVELPGRAASRQVPATPALPPPPVPGPAAPPRPAPSAGTAGDGTVRALMPGRIVRVNVGVGDSIAEGQAVLVMESMKMENTIVAPAAGTVTAVLVAEGDSVQHGQTLVELG